MEAEKLRRIGFSEAEAKVYLALLQLGQARAGEISKKSQINRTTTYDALERLLDKGLITYFVQTNRKVFKSIRPNKILEFLKEQEKEASEIIPQLDKLHKTSGSKEEFKIYQGRKGIRSILQDVLKYKEYISFGSRGKFSEIMKHDFVAFQNRKKELKIKSRVIINESSRKTKSVKISYATFKFIPDEYSGPSTTLVYGDNIAVMIWGEIPMATVIKSKEVVESYKNYFEYLWKAAKL